MTAGSRLRLAIISRQHRLAGSGTSKPLTALASRPCGLLALPIRPSEFNHTAYDRRSFASKTSAANAAVSGVEDPLLVPLTSRSSASLAYETCLTDIAASSSRISASGTAQIDPRKRVSGMREPVRLSQQRGGSQIIRVVDGKGEAVQRATPSTHSTGAIEDDVYHERIVALLYKIFLPTDFPASVASNYLRFTGAMTIQIFLGNVSRVLATQAMLLALGFGSQTALPFAVVTAWILKDGLGHLGAIGVGTVINRRFDSDPKRFRFFAAAIGKVADILSIFTLGWPQYFLVLSTLGSTCGRISSGTALNCRAKVYETFALDANLGDVMRCAQAQSTAAQLLGTGLGVVLGPIIGCDMVRLLMVNSIFSVATLASSYFASAAVRMTSLNLQRAERVFHNLIPQVLSPSKDNAELNVMTTDDVQAAEVFVSQYRSVFGVPLVVNPPMLDHHQVFTPSVGYRNAKYILAIEPRTGTSRESVALWIREGAAPVDVLRGFFQACVLRILLGEPALKQPLLSQCHARCETIVDIWWGELEAALKTAGWRTDVVFLDTKTGRLSIA